MRKSRGKGVLKAAIIALVLVLAAAGLLFAFGNRIRSRVGRFIYPLKYTDLLTEAADRYGLDRTLVAAVTYTESGFDPKAVSGAGAVGLMQVMPETAEWIAYRRGIEYKEGSLFDEQTNFDYGCWLLSYLLDRYDGSARNALIAYNAGHNRLDEWLKTGTDENGELIDIPIEETRAYVNKVLRMANTYGEIYENELGH